MDVARSQETRPEAPRRHPAGRPAALLLCAVLAALALASGALGAGQSDPPFPRTLGVFLTQDQLPGSTSCTPGAPSPLDASVLGRFDAIVIDAEWSNPARLSCYSPSAFDQIRAWAAANSGGRGITILPYVNPVDRPGSMGTNGYYQYRYDMWGCRNAVTFGTCAFPKQWLAHTSKGQLYSEYRGTWMSNLTDAPQPATMPAGASSVTGSFAAFEDYFGTWIGSQWNDPARPWSAIWDGVYLDVWGDRIWNNSSPWDPYWGGPLDTGKKKTNYATSVIYADPPAGSGPSTPSGLWQRGIAAGNARIQGTPAGAPPILVANNTQSATTAPGENGRLWESFADPALGRQWLWDVPGYVDASGPNPLGFGTRTVSGSTFLTAVDGQFPASGSLGAADYQRARFDLGSALLGNGYWGAATAGYDAPLYFDEMDGGTLHRRGYLGQAVDPRPSWARLDAPYVAAGGAGYTGEGRYANGVYRRDFANSAVLVNPSSGTQTVPLGTTMHHLRGIRSTSPNDGLPVTSVTLAKNDAVILVSAPPPAG